MAEGSVENPAESRIAPRTNVMLSGNIESGGLNASVRIRNLSETGALVEGGIVPATGSRLILKRLDLEIAGEVVWSGPGRCGVRFEGCVCVSDWIAGRQTMMSRTRVEEAQAEARIRSASFRTPVAEALDPVNDIDIEKRLAEELGYVQRLLETMGDDLAGDPAVLQRHFRSLQGVDLACQILGHVAAVITASDRTGAVAAIGMEELRARLLRKAVFAPAS